jgi:hypothetical protein
MQEFIDLVVRQLGTSEGTARSATGGILNMIRENADQGDAKEFVAALPGADALLETTENQASEKSGGLLGGALKQASALTGGKLGGALGLAGALSGSDLDKEQFGPFVSMFFDFAKSKVDGDLIARVLGKVPELGRLVS